MLLVKGPNVMKGYLHEPEKTAEVIRDGWYVTGDIAKIDKHGFIEITGRLSRGLLGHPNALGLHVRGGVHPEERALGIGDRRHRGIGRACTRRGGLVAGAVALVATSELALLADGASATAVVDALAGSVFLAIAIVQIDRPQGRRSAALAGLAGLAWLAANLITGLAPLHRPLLVHAVLGSPDGRLRGRLPQAVTVTAWTTALVGAAPPRSQPRSRGRWPVRGSTLRCAARSLAAPGLRSWRAPASSSRIAIGGPALLRLADRVSHDASVVTATYTCVVAVAAGSCS